jgi:hypothetical protein
MNTCFQESSRVEDDQRKHAVTVTARTHMIGVTSDLSRLRETHQTLRGPTTRGCPPRSRAVWASRLYKKAPGAVTVHRELIVHPTGLTVLGLWAGELRSGPASELGGIVGEFGTLRTSSEGAHTPARVSPNRGRGVFILYGSSSQRLMPGGCHALQTLYPTRRVVLASCAADV